MSDFYDIHPDGGSVVLTINGQSVAMTADQACHLADDFADAADAARAWVAYDPFHKDETNDIEDER